MNKLVITFELPDGVVPDVQYVTEPNQSAAAVVPPPSAADLPPQEFPPFPGTAPAPRGTDGPACEHGGMVWKTGTSEKSGKAWKGWFCSLKGSACKPVWQ